jgi:hypothetical protein
MVKTTVILVSVLALCVLAGSFARANGGPFVLKYPNGDPAAKGVLARLDPDLKPSRETRLRVIKEDLKVTFGKDRTSRSNATMPPLVRVSAEYTIENPTSKEVEVDFGFPILRGVYISLYTMMPRPDVNVRLNNTHVKSTIISNSAIYGIIRQRAREVIEKAVADNPTLNKLVASVYNANSKAREVLHSHLVDSMNWNERDATLMVEYASLDFGKVKSYPPDRSRAGWGWGADKELNKLMNENLGPLAAIGEQKATQFFAQIASHFDPEAASAYEAIFTAWGGDVRERSVDLATGKVRPREITVEPSALNEAAHITRPSDPTIYARVDYLDPKAKISESEKASCEVILKNLPVIFTFAPMNILHYQVKFPAKSAQTLTVSYSQYAYSDTHLPSSYQLAYVVHPASLWKEFGPINLEVAVPEGVVFRGSVACSNGGVEERVVSRYNSQKGRFDIYRAILKQKSGELYLAIDAEAWKKTGTQVAVDNSDNRVPQVVQQAKRKVSR